MINNINILINKCIDYLQSVGLLGGFLLIVIESILPFMPLGVFIGFNTLAYGAVTGFIVSWIGTIFGCMLSYSLFRWVLKGYFYRIFKGKKKKSIEKFMKKMTNIDFNGLVILLALPFTPAFVVNIAAGLSNISWKKYLVALCISKISIIYFWGYVGGNFIDNIFDPIVLLKILGIVLGAYILSKIIEKIIKVEE